MRTIGGTIDIDRPVEAVYGFWQNLESLPDATEAVAEVRRIDERRSHWSTVIAGEKREWDAEIVEAVPNRLLAWRGDGELVQGGTVSFQPLDERRTRVSVHVDWEPRGTFDKIGDRFGIVTRQLQSELSALKEAVEARIAAAPVATDGHDAAAGRGADSPSEIPAPGWKAILKRTFKQLKSDNVPIVAAGVAFFTFLALVPALVAIIGIWGMVADPATIQREMRSFLSAVPGEARDLLLDQVRGIVTQGDAGLGISVTVGILAALWSASKGMQALVMALNIAYDEEEGRTFFKLRGLSLLLTVGLAVAAVGGATAMVAAGGVAERLGSAGEVAVNVLRWPLLAGAVILGLAVLYRYAPDRDNPRWRWVTPGAVVSTVLWTVASIGFSFYVGSFGKYDESYGSLGAVVVLMLWLQISAYIIVLGAEFDAETERQTARDTTTGRHQPMGERDAYAADTVAASQ